jgi:antitoxin VapB
MMENDMIVLSQETERLVRLVAERGGKTPEQVINEAVEACAREVGIVPGQEPQGKPSFERMMAISERFASYPVLDARSPDDIIGYDEYGVPH